MGGLQPGVRARLTRGSRRQDAGGAEGEDDGGESEEEEEEGGGEAQVPSGDAGARGLVVTVGAGVLRLWALAGTAALAPSAVAPRCVLTIPLVALAGRGAHGGADAPAAERIAGGGARGEERALAEPAAPPPPPPPPLLVLIGHTASFTSY